MTADLSSFWNDYKHKLIGGGAGAGLGALALGGATSLGDDGGTPEEHKSKVRRNALLGAALGGVTGLGAGALYDRATTPPEPKGVLGNFADRAVASKGLAGLIGAHGVHGAASKWALPKQETTDKRVGELQKLIDQGIAVPDGKSPVPPVPLTQDKGWQDTVRSHIEQITGSKQPLGRLSQTRVGRNLGVDLSPGEEQIAGALSRLHSHGGPAVWDSLLGGVDASGKGTGAHPFIREAVGGNGNAISGAHLRSTLGRSAVGLAALPGLSLLNSITSPGVGGERNR